MAVCGGFRRPRPVSDLDPSAVGCDLHDAERFGMHSNFGTGVQTSQKTHECVAGAGRLLAGAR